VTDEGRLTFGNDGGLSSWPIGETEFSPRWVTTARTWLSGLLSDELLRSFFTGLGPHMLADIGGDRSKLHELVDPEFRALVDQLTPVDK